MLQTASEHNSCPFTAQFIPEAEVHVHWNEMGACVLFPAEREGARAAFTCFWRACAVGGSGQVITARLSLNCDDVGAIPCNDSPSLSSTWSLSILSSSLTLAYAPSLSRVNCLLRPLRSRPCTSRDLRRRRWRAAGACALNASTRLRQSAPEVTCQIFAPPVATPPLRLLRPPPSLLPSHLYPARRHHGQRAADHRAASQSEPTR